jgi:hypothetical protein
MSTAKVDAKKIRRAVQDQAAAIRERVAVEIVGNLCALPLPQRLKWAWKIARGIRLSPWDRVKMWSTEKARHARRLLKKRKDDAKTNKTRA